MLNWSHYETHRRMQMDYKAILKKKKKKWVNNELKGTWFKCAVVARLSGQNEKATLSLVNSSTSLPVGQAAASAAETNWTETKERGV